MPLAFFLDQCVPAPVGRGFRDAGYTVIQLADYIPVDSPDRTVIAKAQELDAILVSLNGDFADIVAYPPGQYGGIVALQIRNHPEVLPTILSRLTAFFEANDGRDTHRGKLIVAEPHRIRIHH